MVWRLLAGVLPLVLAAGFVVWGSAPAPYVPSELVLAQDARLAERPVDFVVVGPSAAAMDLDLKRLAQSTGLGVGVSLSLNSSTAAHWYAMLRERVYAAGQRPRLVVVAAPLVMAVDPAPLGAKALAMLADQAPVPDAVLAQKVYGSARPAWVERLVRRRAKWSRNVIDAVRGPLVGACFGAGGEGLAVHDAAAAAVFEGDQGRTGVVRLLPVVEEEAAGVGGAAAGAPILADLFDLVRLAGGRAVFVRLPLGEQVRSFDALDVARERAAVELIEAHGAGYLDLRHAVTERGEFADNFHLNRLGRLRLTAALGEALTRSGALGSGPMAAAVLPMVPTVRASGVPPRPPAAEPASGCRGLVRWAVPELAALRGLGVDADPPLALWEGDTALVRGKARVGGCDGVWAATAEGLRYAARGAAAGVEARWTVAPPAEAASAWWLAPGTGLVVEVDRPPAASEAGVPELALQATQVGGVGAVVLSTGGVAAAATGPVGDRRARLPVQAAGAWSATVQNPADGGWVLLRRLSIADGAARVVLAGPPPRDERFRVQEAVCDGALPLPALDVDAAAGRVVGAGWRPRNLGPAERPLPLPVELRREGEVVPFTVDDDGLRLDRGGGRVSWAHGDPVTSDGRWVRPGERCVVGVKPQKLGFAVKSVLLGGRVGVEGRGSLHVELRAGDELLAQGDFTGDALTQLARLELPAWRVEPFELVVAAAADAPWVALAAPSVADE